MAVAKGCVAAIAALQPNKQHTMTNIRTASLLAALVALPTLSFAGTTEKKTAPAPVPEKLNESAITGDIGLNVVSTYYSRGMVQPGAPGFSAKHSAQFQPYADVFLKAYEGDGFLNKVVFTMGLWNNMTNPAATKTRSTTKFWEEADFMPGVALTFGKVTLTETYLWFESPNDSFGQFGGLNSKLAYDDGDLLGAFALHPSITWLNEGMGKAGNGPKKGDYLELAVAPGYALGPVAFTLPLTLGTGQNGFYAKNGYAYFSAGLNVAYTLPVSKTYGTWTATAGLTYYNTDKKTTLNPSADDLVVSGGFGVAF